VSTPGGKEHLAAVLGWLQGKYVRYIATAHSDALNRARQLQYEVRCARPAPGAWVFGGSTACFGRQGLADTPKPLRASLIASPPHLPPQVKDQTAVAAEVKALSDAVAAKQGALAEKLDRLQVGWGAPGAAGLLDRRR
jgi:hypothetical protein